MVEPSTRGETQVEIKIDKGVPVPPSEYEASKHAKRTMDVGDSYFTKRLAAACVGASCPVTAETGRTFLQRVEGKGYRVWRLS